MTRATLYQHILFNVYLTSGYLIGAWFGTLMISLPSQASPIWPASGVALAAFWIYGKKSFPGIFIGAVLAQCYSSFIYSSADSIVTALIIGTLMGSASTAQAYIGSCLINTYVGREDPLVQDNKIIRFLFLGGPVSCLIAPTLGILILLLSGSIGTNALVTSLSTSWVGETMGVLIFTPLVLVFAGQPRKMWKSRRHFVGFPVIVLLILVVLINRYATLNESVLTLTGYKQQVKQLNNELIDQINDYVDTNQLIKGLFDSSSEVTQKEFQDFTHPILLKLKSLQALEWIQYVQSEKLAEYQALYSEILEADKEGKLKPVSYRKEYYAITFLEPLKGNERAKYYDIGSNPNALKALQYARDSGATVVSNKIRLIQDNEEKSGVVIYSPVYKKDFLLETTEEQRQQNFLGIIATVFRVEDAVVNALNKLENTRLHLKVEDGQDELFNNIPANIKYQSQDTAYQAIEQIKAGHRHWRITYQPSPEFFSQQLTWNVWLISLSGFFFTGLSGMGLLMLSGRTIRMETEINVRTHALKVSNESLAESENQLRLAATTFETHEGIIIADNHGKILRVNKAFSEITGYLSSEVMGRNPRFMKSGHHNHYFYRELWRQIKTSGKFEGEIWNRRKDGVVFPVWQTITAVKDQHEAVSHFVAIFSDITEKKKAENEIHDLAFYDPLTGLANRRLILTQLSNELAIARRQNSYGSVIFLDLDRFKILNDSLGHHIGDELLIQVANRLKNILREEDIPARIGGDEFVILLHANNKTEQWATDQALFVAQKIQNALTLPYLISGFEHHSSPSIGISTFPDTQVDGSSAGDILQQADKAMYQSKERGRNTISFFHPSMQDAADARLFLEKELRRALNRRDFVLFYQPQTHQSGKIVGVEALIRWDHPEKGLISPAHFIPVAEETGLILKLGAWVLHEACSQIKKWIDIGLDSTQLSINVSSRQFRQHDFVEQVEKAIKEQDIPAGKLIIELTEGVVIDNIVDTVEKMKALKQLGVKISIDDFGTGYSSLTYLKKLPLDELKIDQSFVKDIASDSHNEVIIETIINMAHNLGLSVIAEGVETGLQRDFLFDKGCSVFQGYYFAKPMPADAFQEWMKKQKANTSIETLQ